MEVIETYLARGSANLTETDLAELQPLSRVTGSVVLSVLSCAVPQRYWECPWPFAEIVPPLCYPMLETWYDFRRTAGSICQ